MESETSYSQTRTYGLRFTHSSFLSIFVLICQSVCNPQQESSETPQSLCTLDQHQYLNRLKHVHKLSAGRKN